MLSFLCACLYFTAFPQTLQKKSVTRLSMILLRHSLKPSLVPFAFVTLEASILQPPAPAPVWTSLPHRWPEYTLLDLPSPVSCLDLQVPGSIAFPFMLYILILLKCILQEYAKIVQEIKYRSPCMSQEVFILPLHMLSSLE